MMYPIRGKGAAAQALMLCENMFPVVVRMNEVSPIHDHLFFGQKELSLIVKMQTLDAWCAEQFGPTAYVRARPLVNPGVYCLINDEADWVRVEDEYRFRNTTLGTAFKLVWC